MALETVAERQKERIAELEKEIAEKNRLFEEAAKLMKRVPDMLAQAEQKAQLQAYRASLERSRAEINRQVTSSRSAPRSDWVFARDPRITTVSDHQWVINGNVRNANTVAVEGYVYVDITCNGRQVGSERIRMVIPPNTVRDYSTEFRPINVTLPCSASAEWSEQ